MRIHKKKIDENLLDGFQKKSRYRYKSIPSKCRKRLKYIET